MFLFHEISWNSFLSSRNPSFMVSFSLSAILACLLQRIQDDFGSSYFYTQLMCDPQEICLHCYYDDPFPIQFPLFCCLKTTQFVPSVKQAPLLLESQLKVLISQKDAWKLSQEIYSQINSFSLITVTLIKIYVLAETSKNHEPIH